MGDLSLLAVENLESYDPDAFLPLLDRLPVSLCLDVGHLLKRSQGPLPFLKAHLERTRVVHLHGCRDGLDHRGLDALPEGFLARLLDLLVAHEDDLVLTLELFSEQTFFAGREMVLALMESYR